MKDWQSVISLMKQNVGWNMCKLNTKIFGDQSQVSHGGFLHELR